MLPTLWLPNNSGPATVTLKEALEQVEEEERMGSEYGLIYWRSLGMILRGWERVEQGDGEVGRAQIHEGSDAYRDTGSELTRPYYLALLAEYCGTVGNFDKGLNRLQETLALVIKTADRRWEAELHRLRGELT